MEWRGPWRDADVHGVLKRAMEYGNGQGGFERTREGWSGLGLDGEGQVRVLKSMEGWEGR